MSTYCGPQLVPMSTAAPSRAHVEADGLGAAVLGAEEALDDRDVGLERVAPAGEAVRAVGGVRVDDLELRLGGRRGGVGGVVGRAVLAAPRGRQAVGAVAAAWAVVTTSARLTSCSWPRVSRWVSRSGCLCGSANVGSASVASAKTAAPMEWRRIISAPRRIDPGRPPLKRLGSGRARVRCPSGPPARPVGRRSASGPAAASPSKSGAAPLSSIEPVLSPIARISATSSALSTLGRATAASSARLASIDFALPGSSISVGATTCTGPWARFQWQASCSSVSPWRSAIGRIALELRAPGLDPARRAGSRGGRSAGTRGPGEHVVVEQPAVVDDAGDQLHAVALGGRQHQLARPRLERVEDHHRPVDPVAEALQAVDHVEREAVGGAGRDAQLRASARRRGRPPARPRRPRSCSPCGPGCAGAAGRRRRRRSARGCALSPSGHSPRSPPGRAGADP